MGSNQIEKYLRVKEDKELNIKYVALVNPIVNKVLETDIIINDDIEKFVMDNTNIIVTKEMPKELTSLEEFKGFITLEAIKVSEIPKSPTEKVIEGLMVENAQLIKANAVKDLKFKAMQNDISSLMVLISKISIPLPKIIKE